MVLKLDKSIETTYTQKMLIQNANKLLFELSYFKINFILSAKVMTKREGTKQAWLETKYNSKQ